MNTLTDLVAQTICRVHQAEAMSADFRGIIDASSQEWQHAAEAAILCVLSNIGTLLSPLDWKESLNANERHFADTIFGRYEVLKWNESSWGMVAPNEQINDQASDKQSAMDLAFDNYVERIRLLFLQKRSHLNHETAKRLA